MGVVVSNLDLEECTHTGTTYRAGVVLQTNDLGAALAQAEMSARQDNGVLCVSVADNAFGLNVTLNWHRVVVYSEHVIHVKYGFVVQKSLLDGLVFVVFRVSFLFKRPISVLDLLFRATFVAFRKVGFNTNNYWVVIVFLSHKLVLLILCKVKLADSFRKPLL